MFIFQKWNPNLTLTKSEPKNGHFSPFWHCAWQEKCIFASSFQVFLSRAFTVNIFHIPFFLHFVCSSAKYIKMTRKWDWKWAENGLKMATMNNPNIYHIALAPSCPFHQSTQHQYYHTLSFFITLHPHIQFTNLHNTNIITLSPVSCCTLMFNHQARVTVFWSWNIFVCQGPSKS